MIIHSFTIHNDEPSSLYRAFTSFTFLNFYVKAVKLGEGIKASPYNTENQVLIIP